MQQKTILVTGASGFLGSHVLEALLSRDDIRLIAACRDRSRLLPGFHGEVREGDLCDPDYVRGLLQGIDIVCHTAAWTSLWAHRKQEQALYRDPSIALIDAAIAVGVERFIFDSSVVISGARRDGQAIDDQRAARHPGFWPHMDIVADIENHMRAQAKRGTTMIALRCGHFAGARYKLGFLSLLMPRLKTHLVPWVAGGRARVPLVDGRDLGNAYALAATVDGLQGFECFNICGAEFPTMREVIEFLHDETGIPLPHFGVPLRGAYAFAWLMEKLNIVLPGDPFLTRAIIFLGEDWYAPSTLAQTRLGYTPAYHWHDALRRQLQDMARRGYPRLALFDRI